MRILAILSVVMIATLAVCAQTDEGPSAIKGEVRCNIAPDRLTAVELQALGAHNIVILVDRSGSMNTCDCPKVSEGGSKGSKFMQLLLAPRLLGYGSTPFIRSSRWDWCSAQTLQMSRQAQSALPDGFTVVPFDGGYSIHSNMTTETLPKVFKSTIPFGGTYLGPVLERVCKDYFKRKDSSAEASKPLLIGVITDGVPLDPGRVLKAIVSITHQMHYANEITIVFFLIGQDDLWGKQFISNLIYQLPKKATYNIVRAVPFQELEKSGLARSLAMNLQ